MLNRGFHHPQELLMTNSQDPKARFAEALFGIYPEFLPTQALYIDLEGRNSGQQDILSCYWPVLS